MILFTPRRFPHLLNNRPSGPLGSHYPGGPDPISGCVVEIANLISANDIQSYNAGSDCPSWCLREIRGIAIHTNDRSSGGRDFLHANKVAQRLPIFRLIPLDVQQRFCRIFGPEGYLHLYPSNLIKLLNMAEAWVEEHVPTSDRTEYYHEPAVEIVTAKEPQCATPAPKMEEALITT